MRVRKSKRPQRRNCRTGLISVGSVILLHVFFHPSRGEIWKQLIKWRWRTHCCCRSLHSLRTRRPLISKFRYHKFGRQLQRLAGLMKRREFCTIQQSDEREDIHYRFKHTGMWLCETQRGCSNRRHADNRTVELMNTEGAGHYWTAVPISSHFSQIRSGFGSTNISQRLNILIGRIKLISGRFYRFFTDLFDHNKLQVNGNTAFIILLCVDVLDH